MGYWSISFVQSRDKDVEKHPLGFGEICKVLNEKEDFSISAHPRSGEVVFDKN